MLLLSRVHSRISLLHLQLAVRIQSVVHSEQSEESMALLILKSLRSSLRELKSDAILLQSLMHHSSLMVQFLPELLLLRMQLPARFTRAQALLTGQLRSSHSSRIQLRQLAISTMKLILSTLTMRLMTRQLSMQTSLNLLIPSLLMLQKHPEQKTQLILKLLSLRARKFLQLRLTRLLLLRTAQTLLLMRWLIRCTIQLSILLTTRLLLSALLISRLQILQSLVILLKISQLLSIMVLVH